jgi:hypothetical protein
MPRLLYVYIDMWTGFETKQARKVLNGAPANVRDKWDLWISIVEQSGPEGLQRVAGFVDKARKGSDLRESRLNDRYRVFYRVVRQRLEVHVVQVTGQHDLR